MYSLILFIVSSYEETIGFPFLKIGIGARPVAMGEAFTAVADDPQALFYNPGGLGSIKRYGISLTTMNVFWIGNYTSAAGIIGIGRYIGIGIFAGLLSAEDMLRNKTGEELGKFSYYDSYVGVGTGCRISKKLSIGGNARFVYSKIYTYSATSLTMDLGALYIFNKFVSFGASLRNLGTPRIFIKTPEFPPLVLTNGIAFKFSLGKNYLLLSADIGINNEGKLNIGTGFELRIAPLYPDETSLSLTEEVYGVLIRGGYKTGIGEGAGAGFSFGMGVEYYMEENLTLVIDGVSLYHGVLGTTERVSFSLLYEPTTKKKRQYRSYPPHSK